MSDSSEHTDSGDPGAYRIGDAERVHAVESLSRHFAEGRLDQSEFDDRTAAVYAARTRGELSPLFFDLPGEQYPDPAYSAATDAAARSARVPAQVVGESSVERVDAEERRRRRDRIILSVTPLVALVVFFLLGYTVGFHISWLAWLAVPIVTAIIKGGSDDEEDDEGDGASRQDGRRELE